jgi:hypothetical protein
VVGTLWQAFCDAWTVAEAQLELPRYERYGLMDVDLTLPERRSRGRHEPIGRWRSVGIGIALAGLACNALLDIDEATLTCAPGACDAGSPGIVGAAPAMGEPGAIGSDGAGVAPAGNPSARSPAAVDPAAGGAPAAASEALGAPPLSGPSATPIAASDAGVGVPPSGESSSGMPPDIAATAGAGPPLDANGWAVALPNDLVDAPVSGEITFSEEATWEVDGVFRPTFEVHTPTGSYWVVKSLGTMVSMQDGYAGQSQWIDFSSGFRPLRNIPAFAAPPAAVSTVLDPDSQTPTHLRLTSDSADGSWHWVWDFYVTHATLTIDRAPGPIGFSYRGVPAGTLGAEDQLVQSDGTAQSARNSFTADVPGPAEWVYVADGSAQRSLILMQHTDDALAETYQVRDNDSAAWVFGGGQITALPVRFSVSLIDSVEHAVVSQRAAYVAGAIH